MNGDAIRSRVRVSAIALVVALSVSFGVAQATDEPAESAPTPPPPCTSPEYRQFDFWIGDWDVLLPDGTRAGTNSITSILGGCALQENYKAGKGYSGHSFNMYRASTGGWHQTWVDSAGLLLLLDGGFADGEMVLQGSRLTRDGKTVTDRITWTQTEEGNVSQLWEQSNDGGTSWSTAFLGTYVRKTARQPG